MTTDTDSKTQIVRAAMERISRDFTQDLAALGFARTRSKFWARRFEHRLDFVHLFRSGSSYGASYNASVSLRVHLGIAVLDDDRDAVMLNGPNSDDLALFRADRFHLRFNASSGSTYERCREDLLRFVAQRAEPWFGAWHSSRALQEREDSPLDAIARHALQRGVDGHASPERVARTLKLFGIKN